MSRLIIRKDKQNIGGGNICSEGLYCLFRIYVVREPVDAELHPAAAAKVLIHGHADVDEADDGPGYFIALAEWAGGGGGVGRGVRHPCPPSPATVCDHSECKRHLR